MAIRHWQPGVQDKLRRLSNGRELIRLVRALEQKAPDDLEDKTIPAHSSDFVIPQPMQMLIRHDARHLDGFATEKGQTQIESEDPRL